MAVKTSPLKTAFLFVLGHPFFVAVGLLRLVRFIRRAFRAVRGFRLGLARELPCPNGHKNSVIGRWECGSCKGTYHGWVGRCEVCGAGASWFPCEKCGVSIKLPWEAG
jgi:hypothetical protein